NLHVLTMRKATMTTSAVQTSASHQKLMGWPEVRWTVEAITPAPAGIGMPTKYFLPGLPGLEGCGFTWILNRASLLAPATRNKKDANKPRCLTHSTIGPVSKSASTNQRNPHINASRAGA